MNPYEYIDELKHNIENDMESLDDEHKRIFYKDHCKVMLNMLNLLRQELDMAEYNYEVESVKHDIVTFSEFTFDKQQLSDEVIILQPMLTNEDIDQIDTESMQKVLQDVHDTGLVKENIVMMPPGINVFRARLARPKKMYCVYCGKELEPLQDENGNYTEFWCDDCDVTYDYETMTPIDNK